MLQEQTGGKPSGKQPTEPHRRFRMETLSYSYGRFIGRNLNRKIKRRTNRKIYICMHRYIHVYIDIYINETSYGILSKIQLEDSAERLYRYQKNLIFKN